jgi:hypothetical protein
MLDCVLDLLRQVSEAQDAYYQAGCGSNQVQGLICHDNVEDAYFHPSTLRGVPEARF